MSEVENGPIIEVTVFESDVFRSAEVEYKEVSFYRVSKIYYKEYTGTTGNVFYIYVIIDSNGNMIAQMSTRTILDFKKDSKCRYTRYILG